MTRANSGLRVWLVALAMGSLALGGPASARPKASTVENDNVSNRAILQGDALLSAGELHGDVKLLTQAADIFQQHSVSLASLDRQTADWAETQAKLGRAHLCIGALTGNLTHYETAVAAFNSMLKVHSRFASPTLRAYAHNNLGGALLGIGKLTAQVPRLQQAEQAFRMALEIYTIDGTPKQWADAQTNLGVTHFLLGKLTEDVSYFNLARDELTSAQPLLAKNVAQSVATIINQIERKIPES